MTYERPFRLVAAGVLTFVAGCELVLGIKDRPLAQNDDAGVTADGTTRTPVDSPNDTTLQDDGANESAAEGAVSSSDVFGDQPPEQEGDARTPREAGPCDPALVPQPPGFDDGTQDLTLQLAARTVDLGIRYGATADAAPPFPGYNLDGLLTCPDQPCMTAKPRTVLCDAGLWCGIDNASLPLFQTFAQLTSGRFHQVAFNTELAAGSFSILFRIRGYNGGGNDQTVEAALFDSNGTLPGPDGSPDHLMPQWDGTDVWTIDYDSVLGGDGGVSAFPRQIDIAAYVTNHVLVAHVDHPIRLYGGAVLGSVVFDAQGTTITGTLTPNPDGTYQIDNGVIAGRWPTANMQSGLKALTDPLIDGGYLCPTPTSSYPTIAKIICAGADLTADPRAQAPEARCDAISFANGFTATAAIMGPVTMRAPDPTTCPDAGMENCEY